MSKKNDDHDAVKNARRGWLLISALLTLLLWLLGLLDAIKKRLEDGGSDGSPTPVPPPVEDPSGGGSDAPDDSPTSDPSGDGTPVPPPTDTPTPNDHPTGMPFIPTPNPSGDGNDTGDDPTDSPFRFPTLPNLGDLLRYEPDPSTGDGAGSDGTPAPPPLDDPAGTGTGSGGIGMPDATGPGSSDPSGGNLLPDGIDIGDVAAGSAAAGAIAALRSVSKSTATEVMSGGLVITRDGPIGRALRRDPQQGRQRILDWFRSHGAKVNWDSSNDSGSDPAPDPAPSNDGGSSGGGSYTPDPTPTHTQNPDDLLEHEPDPVEPAEEDPYAPRTDYNSGASRIL